MNKISWLEYQNMVELLDGKLQDCFPVTEASTIHLIGIPRGGLLVAIHLTYLSDRYEILDPELQNTIVKSKTIVLVDDVLETGNTWRHWQGALRYLVEPPLFAVLIDKSPCYPESPCANLSVKMMCSKEWVLFPYEKDDDEVKQAEKCYGVKKVKE